METIPLISVDWDSVTLLHGAHLRAETGFLEALVGAVSRATLPGGGVARMPAEGLRVRSSATAFEATLSEVQMLAPGGRYLDLRGDRDEPLRLALDNGAIPGDSALLYVGVAHEKTPVDWMPTRTPALLECRGLERRAILALTRESDAFDWLPLARLTREGPAVVRDENFIPHCLTLGSHPALWSAAQRLADLAESGLETAQRQLRLHRGASYLPWRNQVAAAARPLAQIALAAESGATPGTLLAQSLAALREMALLLAGCDPGSAGADAQRCLLLALDAFPARRDGVREDDFWGPTLERIEEAVRAWTRLLPQLTPLAGPADDLPAPPDGVTIERVKVKS